MVKRKYVDKINSIFVPRKKLLYITAAFFAVWGLAIAGNSLLAPAAERNHFTLADNDRAFHFIQDVFEEASQSVAYISCASLQKDENQKDVLMLGSGSGVIVSEQGYIITNHHVIDNAIEVEVILADGRRGDAAIVAESPFDDLALLKVELTGLVPAVLGDSDQVKVGQLVFPIGNPGGAQFARSMTMGMISGIDREIELSEGRLAHLLQTDAAINPGNSGGPLVDCSGRVIGINSIKIVDPEFESMGFAIPINTATRILAALCPEAFGQ